MTSEEELKEALSKLGLPGNILMDMVIKMAREHYYKGAQDFSNIISLSYGDEGKLAVQTLYNHWVQKHKAEVKRLPKTN